MDLSTYIHNNSPSSKKTDSEFGVFFKMAKNRAPRKFAGLINSWFINKPPADPSFLGGLGPLDFPMEFPPGDPLAIYQTLDRWFGNCIPHDAMNEHGIVTWGKGGGQQRKRSLFISKGMEEKCQKKVFEPLKLKNGRTESQVSIGFFSIQFQSEAQCFNIKKNKKQKHIGEFTQVISRPHSHLPKPSFGGPVTRRNFVEKIIPSKMKKADSTPKVEINPAKPTSINTANPKKEHLPHTDDAYTDSPAALLGERNGWMMTFPAVFVLLVLFVVAFCCWCFCC